MTETITSGTCVVPIPGISVQPNPFDFGTVSVGSSKQQNFMITNTGNATLTVNSITFSTSEFSSAVQTPFNVQVAPNNTFVFSAAFNPSGTGLRQATMMITSNAPTTSVTLTGTGSNPSPPAIFMKTLGTPGDDFASSIQKASDGGFIVAGYTRGLGAGREDVLLIKLDASGAMQWAKTAGTGGAILPIPCGKRLMAVIS